MEVDKRKLLVEAESACSRALASAGRAYHSPELEGR